MENKKSSNSNILIQYPDITGKSILYDNLQNDLLQIILAAIHNGVSILDENLNIVYANPTMYKWYSRLDSQKIQKCHQVFHNLDSPCEVCPTLRVFESKKTEQEVVPFKKNKDLEGWQLIYSVPILDRSDNVILVIEYVIDITDQKNAEISQEFFENQNMMLLKLLAQKQEEKETFEKTIADYIEFSIKPILKRLEQYIGNEYIDTILQQFNVALKNVSRSKSNSVRHLLTPKELQVANLIKNDYMSKEIAEMLVISKKTVDYHRANIRKKLNLESDKNLQTFLKNNL